MRPVGTVRTAPAVLPALYGNPWVACGVTADLVWAGLRGGVAPLRRRREVRMLERIEVLPLGWDAAGRHAR